MLKYLNLKLINKYQNKNLNKNEIIKMIVSDIAKNSDLILDKELFLNEILEREKLGTTGIGAGIAIPHARTNAIKDIVVGIGLLDERVDFDSIDDEKVKLVIVIGAPKEKNSQYMEVLTEFARTFRNEMVRNNVMHSTSKENLIEAIAEIY